MDSEGGAHRTVVHTPNKHDGARDGGRRHIDDHSGCALPSADGKARFVCYKQQAYRDVPGFPAG